MGKSATVACRVIVGMVFIVGTAAADTIDNPGFEIGSPLDFTDLAGLGLGGSFLFSQNTMYDYSGDYRLSLVSTDADPSQVESLDGSNVEITSVDLGDGSSNSLSGDVVSERVTPEPATVLLLAWALTCSLSATRGHGGRRCKALLRRT